MTEFIGYIAGALTTICFLPQAIKIIRTRDVGGISLAMYTVFATGVALWMIYGIMIGSKPVIIYNAITLPITLVIIFYVRKYKKNA